jgi:hypothetical protein
VVFEAFFHDPVRTQHRNLGVGRISLEPLLVAPLGQEFGEHGIRDFCPVDPKRIQGHGAHRHLVRLGLFVTLARPHLELARRHIDQHHAVYRGSPRIAEFSVLWGLVCIRLHRRRGLDRPCPGRHRRDSLGGFTAALAGASGYRQQDEQKNYGPKRRAAES